MRFIDSSLLPTFNLTSEAVTGNNNFDPLGVARTHKGETAYIRRYPLRVLRTDNKGNMAYVRGGDGNCWLQVSKLLSSRGAPLRVRCAVLNDTLPDSLRTSHAVPTLIITWHQRTRTNKWTKLRKTRQKTKKDSRVQSFRAILVHNPPSRTPGLDTKAHLQLKMS